MGKSKRRKEFEEKVKKNGLRGAAEYAGETVVEPSEETFRIGPNGEKIYNQKGTYIPDEMDMDLK